MCGQIWRYCTNQLQSISSFLVYCTFFWAEFNFNLINNWTLLIESESNVFTFGVDRYFDYFFRVDIVNSQSSVLLEKRQYYSK